MLNLLLIGPSGIGKSTSIEMAEWLLRSLPLDERPQVVLGASPEKLHSDLVVQPHAILLASELANFFNRQKYMEGMVPYVTELLDCKPVEKRTKSFDILRINEPEVTVMGGSTVEWLQEQLPDSAVSGGFLARFLIIKEDLRRQRVADPDSFLSRKQKLELEHVRARIFQDFYRALHAHKGPVGYADPSVGDVYAEWYHSHEAPSGHLAPFAARAGEFVKRMSMLLALSAQRTGMTEADVTCAIKLHGYTERKLQEVVVPYSPQGKMLALVLKAIGPDGATDVGVKKAMRNFTTAQDTDRLLQSLVSSNDVRYSDGRFYRTL